MNNEVKSLTEGLERQMQEKKTPGSHWAAGRFINE